MVNQFVKKLNKQIASFNNAMNEIHTRGTGYSIGEWDTLSRQREDILRGKEILAKLSPAIVRVENVALAA